jgi:uncharacterized damage-inducible protein DinB
MSAQGLKRLFELNHYAIGANVRDLTHEQSLLQPGSAGNCANWVVGHIVTNRGYILEMIGEKPVWDEAATQPYQRGSGPLAKTAAKPFPEILEALDRSQERLMAGLARLSDKDLGAPESKDTLGGKLAFFQFHEAYHAGQLGLLRRVAGKEGAIK